MHLHLIAVGKRMPAWVTAGFTDFNRRLPPELQLRLTELAPARRGKTITAKQALAAEAKDISNALPPGATVIILDVSGTQHDSARLAKLLSGWLHLGRDVAFVIGGADGLDAGIKRQAAMRWSLSPLTLPHALVRVVLVEQIYRAWTILHNHPYHRDGAV